MTSSSAPKGHTGPNPMVRKNPYWESQPARKRKEKKKRNLNTTCPNAQGRVGQGLIPQIFLGQKDKGSLPNRGVVTDRLTILWDLF